MECELPFSFDEGIAEYDRYCDAAAQTQMEEPSTPETHAVSALADLGQTSSTETSPLSEHVCLTILRWPSLAVEPSIHFFASVPIALPIHGSNSAYGNERHFNAGRNIVFHAPQCPFLLWSWTLYSETATTAFRPLQLARELSLHCEALVLGLRAYMF